MVPDSLKPTSPSPAIQTNVQKDWDNNKSQTPQEAIANSPTKHPFDPSKLVKGK